MKSLAFAGALVFALSLAPPVSAQCFEMDAVLAGELADNAVSIVPDDKLEEFVAKLSEATGETYEGVTRAFVANVGGQIMVGLEVAGCLLDPVVIAAPLPTRNSGRMPNGKTYA